MENTDNGMMHGNERDGCIKFFLFFMHLKSLCSGNIYMVCGSFLRVSSLCSKTVQKFIILAIIGYPK